MRRRLLAAIFVISCTLAALAWVDDLILLRNPAELDTRMRLILKGLFPDREPNIGHMEVDFFGRRVIVEGLSLAEKGSARPIVKVDRLEAVLSLTEWLTPREVTVDGVTGNVRLDKDGKLNVADLFERKGPPGPSKPSTRSIPISVSVSDVKVFAEDEKAGSRVLLTCERAELTIHPDGSITGGGQAKAGALVPESSPFASSGTELKGIPGVRYYEIVPFLHFEIDRHPNGRIAIPIDAERVHVGTVLRSLLPPYVQNVIWDEINPSGLVDARVTLRLNDEARFAHGTVEGLRFEVFVNVKGASVRLKGFPYPITDIVGRFEISPGVISWEDCTARLSGQGRVTRARGSFFLGDEGEQVTIICAVAAEDVPFDETLLAAMPADIREVYGQFSVRGVSGKSNVLVFKGPFHKDPQLCIESTLDGRQSAAFADYPVRFTAEKGTFKLEQGANVTIDTTGSLELGGKAHVVAHVVHGELMHVSVHGDSVPVSPALVDKLDLGVRRMVEPFRPDAGTASFDVIVEKSDPAAQPLPRASVVLENVTVAPDRFPYRLTASGLVKVTPRRQEGAAKDAKPEIKVDLDLTANAPAIHAAVVSGSIVLDPRKRDGDFDGEIHASAARVDLEPEIRRALPSELAQVFDKTEPRGSVKNVVANVRSLHSLDARGEGDGLTAASQAFPYRSRVDRISIAREGRRIDLRSIEGRTAGNGTYSIEGSVELPPEGGASDGATEAAGTGPSIHLAVAAHGVALDPSLTAALPADARATVEKLAPGGKLDAQLRVGISPALPLELTGTITVTGAHVTLDRLDPILEGLAGQPVEDLDGRLRLDGERVWFEAVHGKFRGAPVTVAGSVAMDTGSLDPGVAANASATTVDLVAHVDALNIDESTRKLARGAVVSALQSFPVEGRCDLDLRIRRAGGPPTVDVRLSPRGLKVVPKIVPFPFTDVQGSIEVRNGDPAFIELTARLGEARIEVRRDLRLEAFAPDGAGIYRVKAVGLKADELIARAPESYAKVMRDIDLKGTLDATIDVAVPIEERARSRFLAEVRAHDLALTAGIRFEEIEGTLRVSGSVAKFEALELVGALELEKATWKKQRFLDAKIPLRLHEGELLLGPDPDHPFVGKFYGGQLRGAVKSDFKKQTYEGYLYLKDAELKEATDELGLLADDKSASKTSSTEPVRGELTASLKFGGGGTSPDGHPIGISGEGVLQAEHANLVKVPVFLGTIIEAFQQNAQNSSAVDTKSFDRIYAKVRLKPSHIDVDVIRLVSTTLTLGAKDGKLGWDGDTRLDLLPFKNSGIFDDIFKQFVGIQIRGKIWDPIVIPIPLYNGLDRIWQGMKDAILPESTERVGETAAPRK
jgi:hypothetical protein